MSIKTALNKLTRQPLAYENMPGLIEEINSMSDRACAIVWAAMLDDLLEMALSKKMRVLTEKEYESLFLNQAPLSSFSAKILLGYALNVYNSETKSNLDIVRHIRNCFAHAAIKVSFSTSEVADMCMKLLIPTLSDEQKKTAGPKFLYQASCMMLMADVSSGEQRDSRTLSHPD